VYKLVRAEGLEPSAYGLKIRSAISVKGKKANDLEQCDSADCPCRCPFDKEFAGIVALWPKLKPGAQARLSAYARGLLDSQEGGA